MQQNLPLVPGNSNTIDRFFSVSSSNGNIFWHHELEYIASYKEDNMARRDEMIYLMAEKNGIRHEDLGRALGLSVSRIKQIVKAMRASNGTAIPKRTRKCSVLTDSIVLKLNSSLASGKTLVQLSEETGICYDTLRKAVQRGKLLHPLRRPETELSSYGSAPVQEESIAPGELQLALPVPPPSDRGMRSVEDLAQAGKLGMACVRVTERTLGVMAGCQADTRFENAAALECGGILLALPALVANGLFRHTELFNEEFKKCYYGIVPVLVLMAYMALLRIKSPERLRGWAPGELGRLMGLDRIPEVATLRRDIGKAARHSKAFQDKMAADWFSAQATQENEAVHLYIDGHLLAYTGDMVELPKKYSTRDRLCIPGIMDYWVTDKFGCPLMHIPKTVDDGFASVIIDDFLPKWKKLVPGYQETSGEGTPKRKWFTLVFDRAGCSATLFKKLQDVGIAAMTYRKDPKDEWDEGDFKPVLVTSPLGNQVKMLLAEKMVDFRSPDGTCIKVREIRRLTKGKFGTHQTAILTTEFDVPVEVAAAYMFARWDEENFFKYMTAEYGMDHLLDHCRESLSLSENVVNPAWRNLKKTREKVQGQIKSLAARLQRPNVDLDEIGTADGGTPGNGEKGKYERELRKKEELKAEYGRLTKEADALKQQLKDTPRKIPYADLPDDEKFRTLSMDKKMFADVIKMAAYRAETTMAFQLRDAGSPYGDEARTFLQGVFRKPADIEYDSIAKVLNVKVHPLAEQRQMAMLGRLLPMLNATETVYPGTNITLRYSVFDDKV